MEPNSSKPTMSRRSVAVGSAWAVPAIVAASAAPALAASDDPIVECPTTSETYFGADTASVSSATIGAYGTDTLTPAPGMPTSTYLANMEPTADGTRFGISAQLQLVPPVDILNPDGTQTGRQSTGYYLVPSCTATSCVSGTGYSLPSALPTMYDGYGDPHVGYLQSYTPVGCSPQAGQAGASILATMDTDIYWDASTCTAGPESHLYQVSIPFAIIYIDGLTPVYNSAGTACCNYINIEFAPQGGCTTSQSSTSFSISNSAGTTPPGATNLAPHINERRRLADDAYSSNWCTNKPDFTIYGANFTGATSVTWNGKPITFTVVNDNQVNVTMSRDGQWAGSFYPLKITTPDGTSNDLNMAYQLVC